MKPFFNHNCDRCAFVGQIELLEDMKLDFYICPHQTGETYIARFNNEPGGYYSTDGNIIENLINQCPIGTRTGFLIMALKVWFDG